jgi:hypothetical protein
MPRKDPYPSGLTGYQARLRFRLPVETTDRSTASPNDSTSQKYLFLISAQPDLIHLNMEPNGESQSMQTVLDDMIRSVVAHLFPIRDANN